MKKIINHTDDIVQQMCHGIALAHPEIVTYEEKYKVIKRKNLSPNKVSLISGGGSGHEPAHAGYVGLGMLDAAVAGDVFASPSSIQVYNAIKQVTGKAGCLLIVKNYSGDCMNFDTAAEMAEEDDLKVLSVYVNDDVAVKDSLYTIGRRGVAGTVLVEKIAGASAERGDALEMVQLLAQRTIENVKSIGVALTSCTVPAKGTPTFELGTDEIEFGVGIHGEPGIERRKLMTSNAMAKEMLDLVVGELALDSEDEIVLMVNGLGGTPLHELYVFNNDVRHHLEALNVNVYDTLVGNYMTAIDMAGLSLTVLKLTPELKELYDAPANTIAYQK